VKTMRLIQGIRYGAESLRNRFAGWTPEDADTDGYSIDAYFADDGEYLGPDQHGVEPLFEPADFSARRTGEASLEFAGEEVSEMWLGGAPSRRPAKPPRGGRWGPPAAGVGPARPRSAAGGSAAPSAPGSPRPWP